MEWILVALILGSMVYIGSILIDFTNYSIRLKPHIASLQNRGSELGEAAEQESLENCTIRDRNVQLRESINSLNGKVAELRSKIKSEKRRGQTLEIAQLKSRLRGRCNLLLA